MKKQRTIKYNGLDFTINIDTKQIENKVKGKYKPTIDSLKRLLNKREQYIRKLHNSIRDGDAAIFLFISSREIWRKAVKAHHLSAKEYMILSYLKTINMANIDHINRYIQSVGFAKAHMSDLRRLEEKGVILKTPRVGYFAIVDNGRRMLDQIVNALKQDYNYYKNNKGQKLDHYEKPKVDKGPKYSAEELEKRSFLYKQMMRPFWDGGYKVLPRSRQLRVDYLIKWIEDHRKAGIAVDPAYYRYVERWSAPDRRVRKSI